MRLSAGGTSAPSGGSRGGSGAAASDGLGVLARPFKLRLSRASGERAALKDYTSNIILVEPLATLNAIEDFLYPRVHRPAGSNEDASGSGAAEGGGVPARRSSGRNRGDAKTEGEEETEEDAVDEDDMIDREEDADEDDEMHPPDEVEDVSPATNGGGSGAAPAGAGSSGSAPPASAPTGPRLLFRAPGAGPFHPTTSVLQAVHAAALASAGDAGEDREDGEGTRLSTASLWERTHVLQYGVTPKGQPLPPPLPGAGGSSVTISVDASDADEAMAALGPADRRAALSGMLPALRGKLCGDTPPPGLSDQASAILSVLSVLHNVSASASRLAALSGERGASSTGVATALALPSEAFLSSKLAGKMIRQLGDTLSLCSGSLPAWCADLARACPFLFPFEVRQQLFYCTTFGLARALHRMHGQSQENGAGGGAGSNGRDLRVGRLQRQKVRVSRDKILESAVKVFDMTPTHRMVLEVEFFNEVGTGTGPTLEFYTLLSKELQQRALGAWRDADPRGEKRGSVHAPHGLFPSPIPPGAKDAAAPGSPGGLKRVEVFKLLGRVVGKALQDGRLLDLGLSPAFFRAAAGRALALPDLAEIDPELGRTLYRLSDMARQKSAGVEDMCLTFVLPGDELYELRPGGANVTVTSENLPEYLDAVTDAIVGGGIARQLDAFRAGLSDIMPPAALRVFSESELDCVLCGQGQAWTPELLSECVTFDHGYSAQSPPIKALMEVMCGYGQDEQRSFLRFVTGAPRLPPGGLSALQPKLTVVCKQPSGAAGGGTTGPEGKPISAGTTLADKDLPSAMTCASYLKLPPYSCVEVLKERLGYAITEGVGSFDLS
jgi:E3 ubiquitin-protein ligase TRIP12